MISTSHSSSVRNLEVAERQRRRVAGASPPLPAEPGCEWGDGLPYPECGCPSPDEHLRLAGCDCGDQEEHYWGACSVGNDELRRLDAAEEKR
jgi:hypothetical protein